MLSAPASAFTIPLRVYYEDTDAGGIVYYANYLRFFERCRTEWMRSAGYGQAQLLDEHGIGFVARKASCEYRKPARLDDELRIGLKVARLTRVRVIFHQWAQREAQILVDGQIEIACVSLATMSPTPIPDSLFAALETLT
ncbi:tol-pal system-associated acyl-CoA thioesterase [Azonexus sp.]|uniref:tol-pal system-associated acyl-CoA thioesterase n=1 Tax=Azonexus sp. TaxID=1872668 RepID=UPI0039E494EC